MSPAPRLLAATSNPGKLREFREILEPAGVSLVAPAEVGYADEVEEDGETLEANAAKKARAAARATGITALADDTGLFVDALDGAPGVRSARYAGEAQDPVANCGKLLSALEGVPAADRGAAFRCAIVLAGPDGALAAFTGECRGRITRVPRGANGFGYDPLFEVPELGKTFAEMDPGTKHALSHRGRALEKLREHLAARSGKSLI